VQIKDALPERELELVKLAALGMRNRHIGWRLGIAEDTVKHWFVTIFDKTGTWSRLELVMKWVEEQGELQATSVPK
jgi:two-component system nitrate/nitrite response regulator NarL